MQNIDPRWIFLIFILLLFVFRGNPLVDVVTLAVGAGWAFQAGLAPWRSNTGSLRGSRVTYWRGQRIEIQQPAWERVRSVSPLQVVVSFVYLLLGLGSAYAAVITFLRASALL